MTESDGESERALDAIDIKMQEKTKKLNAMANLISNDYST